MKIAILNKTTGSLQQHLQLCAGKITNYTKIRAVILDYYKTASSFSGSTSAIATNYNGGPAPVDIGNIWRKNSTNAKESTKDTTTETKAQASTGEKDAAKGQHDKGNKGGYNKGENKGS